MNFFIYLNILIVILINTLLHVFLIEKGMHLSKKELNRERLRTIVSKIVHCQNLFNLSREYIFMEQV